MYLSRVRGTVFVSVSYIKKKRKKKMLFISTIQCRLLGLNRMFIARFNNQNNNLKIAMSRQHVCGGGGRGVSGGGGWGDDWGWG